MTLVDTGPLVALFDPRDPDHDRCRAALQRERGPLVATVPVLTEALHLLTPDSRGAAALREFVISGGIQSWFMDDASFSRAFHLMDEWTDHPMDLADASLVVAAEQLETRSTASECSRSPSPSMGCRSPDCCRSSRCPTTRACWSTPRTCRATAPD